mmetsp:Transcript_49590/g.153093  ORF Transcript_49590/g.153093 Transcript_49590/m.153093 type:complete len:478 (-) Transcript_49590:103-1536(-)
MSSSSASTSKSWAAPVVEALSVYQTGKVVAINDRRLGLLYYGLISLVALFVLGYEILYSNNHFDKRDVAGTVLMNVQQPTKNSCSPTHEDCESDFTQLSLLPYCSVYAGNSKAIDPKDRRGCVYEDQHSLIPMPSQEGSMFIPTRVEQRLEVRDCNPTASNNYTCRNEFKTTSRTENMYVADIERYTVLFSHSYQRDTISGNNNNMQGAYLECNRESGTEGALKIVQGLVFGEEECRGGLRRKPIKCIAGAGNCGERGTSSGKALLQRGGRALARRRVRRARQGSLLEALASDEGEASPIDVHGVYAIPDGDVFSLARLLELAGVSLDDKPGPDGEASRSAGLMLDIQVIYNNLHHFSSTFGDTRVEYWYKVAARPMHQVKQEMVAWTDDTAGKRIIQNRHGVQLVVSVQGSFGFFSVVNLLLMLTTASAMLAGARVLTDLLAIYAMKDREFYAEKKYEVADAQLLEDKEGGAELKV